MILLGLLLGLLGLSAVSAALIIVELRNAPEAEENETGFYVVKHWPRFQSTPLHPTDATSDQEEQVPTEKAGRLGKARKPIVEPIGSLRSSL